MNGLTKFSVGVVAAVAAVAVLVVALTRLGPAEENVAASGTASLFDEELVQEIYQRVRPAVALIRADRKDGDSFTPLTIGSGFLVDREGHIATNHHVIQGADRLVVEFGQGLAILAEVAGVSLGNDLALLRVDASLLTHIEPVELGDSSTVRPGQLAVVIGSPFGLAGSVTVGIVGGVDRVLGSAVARPVHGILQTDAVVNPGDSGGPLLNRAGRVVGINTSVQIGPTDADPQNAGRRIGFAIPVNTLSRLLPRLKNNEVLRPALLGIASASVDPLLRGRLDLPVDYGVYVTRVLSESPAQRAGLIPAANRSRGLPIGGDVIVSVDGESVTSTAGFFAELDRFQPQHQLVLGVVRKGIEIQVPVTLAEWPEGENPFINAQDFDPRAPDGTSKPRYPFVPQIPGFSFPDLFPANDPKAED